MTPFMIPQVFLIKSLIREPSSRGLAGIACLIIAYGIIAVSFSSVVSGCLVMGEQRETIKFFSLKGSRRQFKKSQAVNNHGIFLYIYIYDFYLQYFI